ncbi:hypothetical protein [Chryseobacterium echinoideorum]|uniref:hypothetical protein n=1 Tax=Chryseobacterium echinoideorum TaxID=1549648 RepID=UPI001186823A|nr:hypothetical protein [Chryseobacterium echinoideorum]
MKKIFFCAFLGISVLGFARKVATWTSTCGVAHTTSFADHYTTAQIAAAIEKMNESECGTKVKVILSTNVNA